MALNLQRKVISGFAGEKSDSPLATMDANIFSKVTNGILYRGFLQRVGGYSKYLDPMIISASVLSGAIQAIFRVPLNAGTVQLVIATENRIYALNSAGTGFIDISTSSGLKATPFTVTQSDYSGSKDLCWSGASFNFSSQIDNFYLTNYVGIPQVWNGTLTEGSSLGGGISAASYSSGEVTITTNSAHTLLHGMVVEIKAMTTATTSINKCWQIKYVDTTNFKIYTGSDPGAFTVGSATVNITHKVGNPYLPEANFKAKIVRSFANHLHYYNIYDGSSDQPYTIWHSGIGDPMDWTPASDSDAGFVAIPEGGDAIVTAEPLGDYMAIYKKGSIVLEDYKGTYPLPYNYTPQENKGAYSSKSVINRGAEHIFPAKNQNGLFDGFYNFNGQSASIIDSSLGIRDKIRSLLDPTYPELFVGGYISQQDFYVWLFPSTSSGGSYQDTAIVWNREDDTWFFWNLNKSTSFMISALLEFERVSSYTMATLENFPPGSQTMATLPYPMNSSAYSGKQRLILLGDSGGQAYQFDNNITFDGTVINGVMERLDLPLDDDPNTIKYVNRITLRFVPQDWTYTSGSAMQVVFGARLTDGSDIVWQPPATITMTDTSADFDFECFNLNGRLFSHRILTQNNNQGFSLVQVIYHYTIGGDV